MRALVVREPFGGYAKGHAITDPEEMEEVSKTHPHHVIRTEIADEFFAKPEAPKPAAPVVAPAPAAPAIPPAAPSAPSA